MYRSLVLIIAILCSVSTTTVPAAEGQPPFGQTLFETSDFLKVDEAFKFSSEMTDQGLRLHWQIAEHYYLYKERFKFQTTQPGVVLGNPQFSTDGEAKQDPYFGEVHVIHDELSVLLPVTLPPNQADAEIKISYQGCAEAGLCYPPQQQYVLYTNVASGTTASSSTVGNTGGAATSVAPGSQAKIAATLADKPDLDNADGIFSFIQNSSLAVIVGIFFLLGIGLTFTPCVFPMIPIITSIIAGQKTPTMGKSLALSSAYVLGMAVTYAAAGVITGLLGAGANVQAALQDPYLLSVFAIVFVLLALAMFGLYELQLPSFIRDRLNNTSQNLSGGQMTSVFLIGALSALIVSPCVSAPLAGALLYISSTADAVIGGLSLFALGLGMGLPLILISVGGGKFFPKAGAWMDHVKAVFGVLLIAVAIGLISRIIPGAVTMALWSLLIGLSAIQMGAFEPAKAGWPRLVKGLGLFLVLYAVLLMVGSFSGATDPLKPLAELNTPNTAAINNPSQPNQAYQFVVIADQQGLEEQRQIAKQLGKPMLVDFYADWCISCKVMEQEVFPLPKISAHLVQFHLVKADVTENTEANKALLNHFGLFGPPSMIFFDAQGEERKEFRVIGEISDEGLNTRLAQVLGI